MPQQRVQTGPPTGPQTGAEQEVRRRRIDLSVAQVAASALAAVVGAVLASELGVYGTVLGAAVVSIGATTGGAVFQHMFRRTGEQLRSAVVRGSAPERPEPPRAAPAGLSGLSGLSSEWNTPRVLRARRRWTWRSYAIASALVFVLAMAPIVVVELAAGRPLNAITTGQSGTGTSFNPGRPAAPRQETDTQRPGGAGDRADVPSAAPSHSPSAPPSASPSGSPTGAASASPSAPPSPPASPSPSPGGQAASEGGAAPSTGPSPQP
ncbi:hypothetical protein GCM10010441_48130 [Kitasatospora paracochleata]|uniref:Uncharacterized protein n=1 Tax=Kitasatospora paracochleata TaxID=58354 RepID=A0ABT1ISM1_9ACTN|nr:hypothetical protein [Kitasatospora paracochleata]MCP2307906.1 hypothetical protein [Kitasatospora paracochleata]